MGRTGEGSEKYPKVSDVMGPLSHTFNFDENIETNSTAVLKQGVG